MTDHIKRNDSLIPPPSRPAGPSKKFSQNKNDQTLLQQPVSLLPPPPYLVRTWQQGIKAASPLSEAFTLNQTVLEPTIVVKDLYHTRRSGSSTFTLSIPQLELYPGQLTYIGGRAGCGKSTFIKMLALVSRPKEGDISILGEHVRKLSRHKRDDLRGEGITYIPQGHLGLIPHTPVENIQRPLHDYFRLGWSEATQWAHQALSIVGLPKQLFNQHYEHLSGGEKALVAVAKAYAIGRPICLADEILATLDEKSRKDILRLLQDLADQSFTVVVIAHQPSLYEYFHRVIEMENGHIIDDYSQKPKKL